MEDVEGPRAEEKELVPIVSRLVIFSDGAQKSKEATVGIGLPKLLDAVDS